jgi:hypothetical protein
MKSEALKELETLHRKTIRRLFPNVPARLPAPNKFSDKTNLPVDRLYTQVAGTEQLLGNPDQHNRTLSAGTAIH